ncbi:MAG: O-antigen ligase family protein [Bacteroidales bacterium]|nr:O-antigen ligase family protein [Bacteroidales bacterium]
MEAQRHKKLGWLQLWDWIALFHRIVYILLFLALGFSIPVKNRMATWVIGFIVINWAVEMRFWAKLKRIIRTTHRQRILLFTVLYLVYLTGLLYSHNMDYARFDITVKLSLLVFPLLFATIDGRVFSFLRINYIFLTYIAGCIAASVACLTLAWLGYLESGDTGQFFYMRLSVFHHSGYLAMFLNFAIVIIVFLSMNHRYHLNHWHRILIVLLVIFFNLMVVLLSSKMGILSLLVIYLLMSAIFFFSKPTRRKAIFPLAMMATVILLMLFLPQTRARVEGTTNVVEHIDSLKPDTQESTGERILVWRSAWNIIQHHPLFGVGTGDVKDALLEEYASQGITYAYSRNLDAHNQYIQTYLSVGLTGFVLLIAMLVWPAILALTRKDFIYFFFVLLFAMNLLTESMFENQAGSVFYAFFNALLFWYLPDKKKRGPSEFQKSPSIGFK